MRCTDGGQFFQPASDALTEFDGRVSELALAFTQFLPVTGASISTFGTLLGAETISATDPQAERVDEIQFDLGEGPCWDAVATRRPIIEPDLATCTSTAWPAFSAAIQAENIGALFAFPLVFGPLEIGAIDLYSINPVMLTLEQQQQTLSLSATISRIILGHAMQTAETTTDASSFSRRMVHQATGMVMAQLGISAADAYLIIQARAFGEERSMQDVGKDVVERRIRFTQVSDRLEDTP